MKETRKRRSLGRGWKIAVNGLAALVLLFGVWVMMGAPLPTAELRFRRAERENLITPPGEILGSVRRDNDNDLWMVGTSGELVTLYRDNSQVMYLYDRQENGVLMFFKESGLPWVLAADVPKEAVRASLTLRVQSFVSMQFFEHYNGHSAYIKYDRVKPREEPAEKPRGVTDLDIDEVYEQEGERLGDGLFCFQLEGHYPERNTPMGTAEELLLEDIADEVEQGRRPNGLVNWSMTATFYNEEGDEVGTLERSDWEA